MFQKRECVYLQGNLNNSNGCEITRPPLQGGSRWFESSIAHSVFPANSDILYVRIEGREVLPGPFAATRAKLSLETTARIGWVAASF